MSDFYYGAYIIDRKKGKNRPPRRKRGAGVLITVLVLLTAAICVLVFVLPKYEPESEQAGGKAVGGKTFYMLATHTLDGYTDALTAAADTAARGGAGYIYNDGQYRIVASAYLTETEASALAKVNAGSFYFAVEIPSIERSEEDSAVINYITGEWFTELSAAAKELDRGNITDARADLAAFSACNKLRSLAEKASPDIKSAAITASEYSVPQSRTILSYLRYVTVRAVVRLSYALGA